MFKTHKGFTLVEVMIVVGIIAILAGIFLVGSSQFRQSANVARIKADLQKMEALQELYYTKNNAYAGDITTLASGTGVVAPQPPLSTAQYTSDLNQSCVTGVPNDYMGTGTGTSYCISRTGSSST